MLNLETFDVLAAAGIKFWIEVIEKLSIKDVNNCFKLLKYLNGYLRDPYSTDDNVDDKDLISINDELSNEPDNVIILGLGLTYWQDALIQHNVENIRQCNALINNLLLFLENWNNHENEDVKAQIDQNKVASVDETFVKDAPVNNQQLLSEKLEITSEKIHKNEEVESQTNENINASIESTNDETSVKDETEELIKQELQKFRKIKPKLVYNNQNPDNKDQEISGNPKLEKIDIKPDIDNKINFGKPRKGYRNVRLFEDKEGLVDLAITRYKMFKGKSIYFKPVPCDICDEILPNLSQLNNHYNSRHPNMLEAFNDKYRIFKCTKEDCSKSFFLKNNLFLHIKNKHIKKDHKKTPKHCSYCFSEIAKGQKEAHKRRCKERPKPIQQSELRCIHCDEKFEKLSLLQRHKLEVHKLGYNCDICGKLLHGFRSRMEAHKAIHSSENHNCSTCSKKFRSKNHLERHQKRVHSPNLEYCHTCNICGKVLNAKHIFEGHMNMHLGLKPYKCAVCASAYQNESNLSAHVRNTHGASYNKEIHMIKDKTINNM